MTKRKITEPGLYPDLTPEEYFDPEITPTPALGSSGIKDLIETTPMDFRYGEEDEPEKRKRGSLVHQLALGRGTERYQITDLKVFNKTHKAYQAELAHAEATGKVLVKRKDYEAGKVIADAARLAIEAAVQGESYQTEVPMFWKEQTPHGEIWGRGLIDVWVPTLLTQFDLKVSEALHRGPLHVAGMHWDFQAAWYRRGLRMIDPELEGRYQFQFIMVNPKPPHGFRIAELSEAWMTSAEQDAWRAANLYAACLHGNRWPGYERSEIWEQPGWAAHAAEVRELEES